MDYPKRTIVYILAIASFSTIATQAVAVSDPFYQALAKTQKQQYTEASQDLEALGRKLQSQGDLTNAYRSQATASMIRYERDSLAEYKRTGSFSKPDWIRFGSCWGPGVDAINGTGGCSLSVSWVEPPTTIKKFGGLVVLDTHMGYSSTEASQTQGGPSIVSISDTVVVPKFNANELVTSFCKITTGSRKNQGALALATYDSKRNKYTKIRRAWYTDFQTKRIQPIEPKYITCTAFSSDGQ
jgi:hypothetical protein